jgi:putative ABC transport system permease protein
LWRSTASLEFVMPDWKQELHSAFEANDQTCDADVLEELSSHAAAAYETLGAEGHTITDAERRVKDLIEVWVREAADLRRPSKRSPAIRPPGADGVLLAGLMQDVRYGVRLLHREPGFAAVAILTMALGIGATTLLFSVAYGVLLKPLPWLDAAQLVRVTETRHGRTGRVLGTVSNGTFLAWRDHRSTIEDLGGWLTQTATLSGVGDPVRVPIIPMTPSLFRILRVHPLIGRLFTEDEGGTNQAGAVILSYRLWHERFGGRSDIVGQVLQLNDKPYTIVGVMSRDFAFPDIETGAWTAWRVPPVVANNGALVGVIFRAIARLRPGTTPEQAAAEATSRARSAPDMGVAARALFGAAGPIKVSAVPELQAITADVKPAILVLLAAVALLLITATANVASLQLARATVRRREMVVRAAIGAGQRRIVRQLLIESTIVGLCGGAAGLALAAGFQRVLPWLLPDSFPRLDAVALDIRALSFALAVSILASVACGLLPAWHTRRLNLVETLSEDGVASISGAIRSPAARTRALIMVGQVAIACLLLVGATLLTRSFVALVHADRGYDPVNVLTAQLPLPPGFPAERRGQLLETLVERLRAVPGVTHAAYSTGLPFVSAGGFAAFNMRSPRNPDVEIEVQATQRLVSPDYFAAMRLRLIEGRRLSAEDTAATPPVVVVNRTFARQYIGDDPIGVRIPLRGPRAGLRFANEQADAEIVGVVDDMRQDSVDASPQPEIFASLAQILASSVRNFAPILVIRTTADPILYVPTLRDLMHEQAPTLALDSVTTMEDRVMTSLEKPRLYAVVLAWFGMFALLVAGVGLFGVLSFSVAQRTREIGVRSALGAQAHDIIGLILHQALWIVGIGILVGLGAALAGVRLLSAFLYGISPHDAVTFVAVPIMIVAIAGIASFVPARRAANVDPLTALRAG